MASSHVHVGFPLTVMPYSFPAMFGMWPCADTYPLLLCLGLPVPTFKYIEYIGL